MALRKNKKYLGLGVEAQDLNLNPIQTKHVTPPAAPTQDTTTPTEPELKEPVKFDYTAPDALRKAAEYATRMGDVDAARELVSGKYTGFDANGNLLGKDITKGQKRRLNAARFFGVNTGLTSQQDDYIAAQNAALKAGVGIYDEDKAKYDAELKRREDAKAKAEAEAKANKAAAEREANDGTKGLVDAIETPKADIDIDVDPFAEWRKALEAKAKGMGSHRGWLGQDGGDLNDENNWGWKDAEGNWRNDFVYNLFPTTDEDKLNGLYINGRRYDYDATNPFKKDEDHDAYKAFEAQQQRAKSRIAGRYSAYGDNNYVNLGKNQDFKDFFKGRNYLNISGSIPGMGTKRQIFMVQNPDTKGDEFYEYNDNAMNKVDLAVNNGLVSVNGQDYGEFLPLANDEYYTYAIPEGAQIKAMRDARTAAAKNGLTGANSLRDVWGRGVRFREGGKIDYDKIKRFQMGGSLRSVSMADKDANLAASQREQNRTATTKEVVGSMSDSMGLSSSPYQLSTSDKAKLAGLAMDVSGVVAGLTGAGAPVAGLLGAAGTTANVIADWNNEELTTGQKWGNALLGYGLDAASAIPLVGMGAKTAKLAKVAKGLGKGVQAAMVGMGLTAGANALSKLSSNEEMTIDDWRNLAAGVQGLMGGANMAAGWRGRKAINPKATLKTNKGRTLEFANEAAAKKFAKNKAEVDAEINKIKGEAEGGATLDDAKKARLAELTAKSKQMNDKLGKNALQEGETIVTKTTGKSWQKPWGKNEQGKREMRWIRSSGEETPVIGKTNSGYKLMNRAEAEGLSWDRRASAWWNERMGFVKPGQANTAKPTAEQTKKPKPKGLPQPKDTKALPEHIEPKGGGQGQNGGEVTPPPGGNGGNGGSNGSNGNGGSNGGGEKPTPKALPQPKGAKALPPHIEAPAKASQTNNNQVNPQGTNFEAARKALPSKAEGVSRSKAKAAAEAAANKAANKAAREKAALPKPKLIKKGNTSKPKAEPKPVNKTKAKPTASTPTRRDEATLKNQLSMGTKSTQLKNKVTSTKDRREIDKALKSVDYRGKSGDEARLLASKAIDKSNASPEAKAAAKEYVKLRKGGVLKAQLGSVMPNLTSASTKSNKLPSLSGIVTPENLRLATSFVGNKKLMDKVKDLPRPSGTDPIHYDRMSNYGVSSIMPQISAINQSANTQKPMYTDAKLNATVNLATNANANEARNNAYNSLAASNKEVDAKNIELGNTERLANLQRAAANRKEQEAYNSMINTNEQALIRSNFASLDNWLGEKAYNRKLAKQTLDQIDYSEAARAAQNAYVDENAAMMGNIDKKAAALGMDRADYLLKYPEEMQALNKFKRDKETEMLTKLNDYRRKTLPTYGSGGKMTVAEKKEMAAYNANLKAQQQAVKDYNTLMRDKAKEQQRMLELMTKRLK